MSDVTRMLLLLIVINLLISGARPRALSYTQTLFQIRSPSRCVHIFLQPNSECVSKGSEERPRVLTKCDLSRLIVGCINLYNYNHCKKGISNMKFLATEENFAIVKKHFQLFCSTMEFGL